MVNRSEGTCRAAVNVNSGAAAATGPLSQARQFQAGPGATRNDPLQLGLFLCCS
jgi:hypothetical protein